MLFLASLLPLAASLAVAQPIPSPSAPQYIRQGPSCLGLTSPRAPAQMMPCTGPGNVQWQATIDSTSGQYKLKNVLFGCYASRNENPNTLLCQPEDQASSFIVEQVTDRESMIIHEDQAEPVALHTIREGEFSPVYFGPDTPDVTSRYFFTPAGN